MLHGIHHSAYLSSIRPRIVARHARHNLTSPRTDVAKRSAALETDPAKEEWRNS